VSINEEELTAALSAALGGQPSTEEGLDYARMIMQQNMRAPGIDPSVLDPTRQQQEGVVGVLQQARERLMAQRGPSRAEKLFALSAGLGAPTKTGSIGETAGNVASQMLPIAQEQRQFEGDRDNALFNLDMAEAQSMGPVNQAELGLAELEYKQRQQNVREALKTISRGGGSRKGSAGSRTREAKIADLINLSGYTRKEASSLVDGFVNIELVPETGQARLINEVDGTVKIVPIGELGGLSGYFPDDTVIPETGTVTPGEVDTRTQQEKDAQLLVSHAFKEGASLFDMAGIGSGPIPTFLAGISIPSSLVGGPVATETLIAQQGLKLRNQLLTKSLVENPRMPVRLVELAMSAAGIDPGFFETGPIMQAKMISLDQFLYQKYLEQIEYSNNANLPIDLQESGKINSEALGLFLRDMGVPKELQRRELFRPIDEDPGAPEMPSTPPKDSNLDQRTWDLMTGSEKARIVELLEGEQ